MQFLRNTFLSLLYFRGGEIIMSQQQITEDERVLFQLWGVKSPEKMTKMKGKLTLEETKLYLKEWRELGNQEALGLLLYCNDGLVGYHVKRYIGKGISFEELQSVGRLGLLKGLSQFDYQEKPMKGFSSYISVSILNRIRDEFREQLKHNHTVSFSTPIKNCQDEDVLLLDNMIGFDSEQLMGYVMQDEMREKIQLALQELTSQQQQILVMYYCFGQTQLDIAQQLGCSKQNVNQQHKQALGKLKKQKSICLLND